MIKFKKINNSEEPLFSEIYNLYVSAFPPEERRDREGFEQILNAGDVVFEVYALMCDGSFAGLLTYWNFDLFCYVEHFAITELMRGKKFGSEALEALIEAVEKPVVVEVEEPTTDQAVSRIRFYERLGFKSVEQAYLQPYYDGSGRMLPLIIMSTEHEFAERQFNKVRDILYEKVYNYIP